MQVINPDVQSPIKEVIAKKVGDYDVLDSGVFHTTNSPILISINSLKLNVQFVVDNQNTSKRFSARVDIVDSAKLIIEIINYHTESSAGLFDPIEIGSIGGHKYYFTFVLNCFVDGGKQLFYSLLKKG